LHGAKIIDGEYVLRFGEEFFFKELNVSFKFRFLLDNFGGKFYDFDIGKFTEED
jgi:hypothetical protein